MRKFKVGDKVQIRYTRDLIGTVIEVESEDYEGELIYKIEFRDGLWHWKSEMCLRPYLTKEIETEKMEKEIEVRQFKIGDRVKFIKHCSPQCEMGDIGTVYRCPGGNPCVRLDKDGYESGIILSCQIKLLGAEEKEVSVMKVKSLSYNVEYRTGKFKVGCQSIDFDDAREIAEFILKQKKYEEPLPKLGVWYRTELGDRLFFKKGGYFGAEEKYGSIDRAGDTRNSGSDLKRLVKTYRYFKEIEAL